ncbi:MAG: DUF4443 domain-containing protein [Candidatus Bipolaricaulia bacterium]
MKGMRAHLAGGLAWLLQKGGPSGRRSLARSTGLGEIVVRQELERLERLGLVEFARQGTRLTPRGRQEFSPILARVREVRELQLRELALDRFTLGALVAGAAQSQSQSGPTSWRLRDLAIREGASGAILIAYAASALRFSDSGELVEARNPEDAALLRKSFPSLAEDDLLILVSAAEKGKAHLGLWRITLELIGRMALG